MANYDWDRFTLRISIRASEEAIRNAWTTQDGIERWLLSRAEFTKPDGSLRENGSRVEAGDTYAWRWHGHADYVGTGEILPSEGDSFLRFTFSGCIVSVTAKHEAGETLCELTQEMPQEKEEDRRYYYIECGKGWTFYMTNLKSTLEGGIDLRNKNNDLHDVINA